VYIPGVLETGHINPRENERERESEGKGGLEVYVTACISSVIFTWCT
jgi:hypothetical protein